MLMALQCFASLSAAIMREACETTHTCVRADAFSMSRASAGSKSGCRLVSGSLRIMSDGGRGVSSAAIQNR